MRAGLIIAVVSSDALAQLVRRHVWGGMREPKKKSKLLIRVCSLLFVCYTHVEAVPSAAAVLFNGSRGGLLRRARLYSATPTRQAAQPTTDCGETSFRKMATETPMSSTTLMLPSTCSAPCVMAQISYCA